MRFSSSSAGGGAVFFVSEPLLVTDMFFKSRVRSVQFIKAFYKS